MRTEQDITERNAAYELRFHTPRSPLNLHLTVVNLCYGSKAINFKGCNFWNQLPENLKHTQHKLKKVSSKQYNVL